MAGKSEAEPQAGGTQNKGRAKELSANLRANLKRRKAVPKKRPSTATQKDPSAC